MLRVLKILPIKFLHKFCHLSFAGNFPVFSDPTSCWSLNMESPCSPSLVYVIYEYLQPGYYTSSAAWTSRCVAKSVLNYQWTRHLLSSTHNFFLYFTVPKSLCDNVNGKKCIVLCIIHTSSASMCSPDHLTLTQEFMLFIYLKQVYIYENISCYLFTDFRL